MHMQMDVRHKVLLVELNEINWRVVDRLIAQRGEDFLPNFRRLRQQGAWAVQSAVERPPLPAEVMDSPVPDYPAWLERILSSSMARVFLTSPPSPSPQPTPAAP